MDNDDDEKKKKEKKRQQDREAQKRYYDSLKENPEKMEEFRKRLIERNKRYYKEYRTDPIKAEAQRNMNRNYKKKKREEKTGEKEPPELARYREIVRDTNKRIKEEIELLSQGDTTDAQRKARQKVIEDDKRAEKRQNEKENKARKKQTMPVSGADSPFPFSIASSPYPQQSSSSYNPQQSSSSSYNIPSFFPGEQSSSSSAMPPAPSPLSGAQFSYYSAPSTVYSVNEGGVYEIGDYDLDEESVDLDFDYFAD
jgi:hypothetical protein